MGPDQLLCYLGHNDGDADWLEVFMRELVPPLFMARTATALRSIGTSPFSIVTWNNLHAGPVMMSSDGLMMAE